MCPLNKHSRKEHIKSHTFLLDSSTDQRFGEFRLFLRPTKEKLVIQNFQKKIRELEFDFIMSFDITLIFSVFQQILQKFWICNLSSNSGFEQQLCKNLISTSILTVLVKTTTKPLFSMLVTQIQQKKTKQTIFKKFEDFEQNSMKTSGLRRRQKFDKIHFLLYNQKARYT